MRNYGYSYGTIGLSVRSYNYSYEARLFVRNNYYYLPLDEGIDL